MYLTRVPNVNMTELKLSKTNLILYWLSMCKRLRIIYKLNRKPFGLYLVYEWFTGVYMSIKSTQIEILCYIVILTIRLKYIMRANRPHPKCYLLQQHTRTQYQSWIMAFDVFCSFRRFLPTFLKVHKWLPYLLSIFEQTGLSKQYKLWLDAAAHGVWSESTLFATHQIFSRINR